MSAHGWRAGREGETHAAARTSSSKTPESFIVGVGASGALLAGAAIVFVTLVGLVSFNVWPTGQALTVGGNIELNAPTPAVSASQASAPPSAAAGQLASTTAAPASGAGGNAGGGHSQGGNDQSGRGSTPKGAITSPPATTPPTEDLSNTGDAGAPSGPDNASKDPAHPVNPPHPDRPHQNISDQPNGKDDQNSEDDSGNVITGKGPLTRPTPPSSVTADSDSSGSSTGHRSPKYKH